MAGNLSYPLATGVILPRMIPMRHLRSNPYFAHLFARVHPLCWPILWWSLNRLFKWYDTSGYEEILFGTTRWGFVYVAFLGDMIPDPSVYRPYARTKPRWDDPAWASDVPLAVALSSTSLRMDANTVLASSGLNGLEGLEGVRIMALIANTS